MIGFRFQSCQLTYYCIHILNILYISLRIHMISAKHTVWSALVLLCSVCESMAAARSIPLLTLWSHQGVHVGAGWTWLWFLWSCSVRLLVDRLCNTPIRASLAPLRTSWPLDQHLHSTVLNFSIFHLIFSSATSLVSPSLESSPTNPDMIFSTHSSLARLTFVHSWSLLSTSQYGQNSGQLIPSCA